MARDQHSFGDDRPAWRHVEAPRPSEHTTTSNEPSRRRIRHGRSGDGDHRRTEVDAGARQPSPPTHPSAKRVGLLPVGNDTAEALYRVVDAAYEKRSIALSSNLHPAGFDKLMPKTIANATVDRLMHHAHVVITAGDSIRLTQATRAKGVRPLGN